MPWSPNERVGLIDGDIIAYSTAWITNTKTETDAIKAVDEMLYNIVDAISLHDMQIYLTGKGNFRKELDPTYKEHRKLKELPQHLRAIFQYLKNDWGAEYVNGIEADDAIGIAANDNDFIICSTDKDLNQIPGYHYNWTKYKVYYVSPAEGEYNFWLQMLTGDKTDNVFGIPGIGPVKAEKFLASYEPEAWPTFVKLAYETNGLTNFDTNLQLLRILQSPIKKEQE